MVISCISYKGGVGKTTLSQNLAVAFAHAGRKVCIVDCDDSLNSADWGKVRKEKSPDLPAIEVFEAKDIDELPLLIEGLNPQYELIIIDSPPSQSDISRMVILMSNLILIPLLAKGIQETNTIAQLVKKIRAMEIAQKRKIPAYFLLNTFNPRRIHMREFRMQMVETFGDQVLESSFGDYKAFYSATYHGMGVTELFTEEDSAQKAANEVINLVNELALIIKEQTV